MTKKMRWVSLFLVVLCASMAVHAAQEFEISGRIDVDTTGPVWYQWDFGDGQETDVLILSGNTSYKLKTTHVYEGPPGAAFDPRIRFGIEAKSDSYEYGSVDGGVVLDDTKSGEWTHGPITPKLSEKGSLPETKSADLKAVCVPWQGNKLLYHTTISGMSRLLSGVIRTPDAGTYYYKWNYGDGSDESAVQTVSGRNRYAVEAYHVYSGALKTPFTARLIVADNPEFENAVDDGLLLRIEADSLDSRSNVAIAMALWDLYKQAQTGDDNTAFKSLNNLPVWVWSNNDARSGAYASPSAAALHAFQINGHRQTGDMDKDPYVEAVKHGLNWLLNGYYANLTYPMLRAYAIGPVGENNPDANGNGIGIEVRDYRYLPIYQGGMVMDCLIASGTPDACSGRDFSGDGTNDTYATVLQDMVDMHAFGQGPNGGWRYSWRQNGDNSASQWAAIGMIPAQQPPWNAVVGEWVKVNNNTWLNNTFNGNVGNPERGGFGYTSRNPIWNWNVVTPSGMVQLNFCEKETTDERWIKAERWLADNWASWMTMNTQGNRYYAYYTLAKAMRLANNATNPVVRFESNQFDWYRGTENLQGLAPRIVGELLAGNGRIARSSYFGATFNTAWAVTILRPMLFDTPPIASFTVHPNPNFADEPIFFDPSSSAHSQPGWGLADIIKFEWDWNNDGIYDLVTDTPETVTHAFSTDTIPMTFPVTLRVTDRHTPPRSATVVVDVLIATPPHPPVAKIGGPYMVSLAEGETLTLDGSDSYDPNEGTHEEGGEDLELDTIVSYDWDLLGAPWDFDDATGAVVNLGTEFTDYFPAAGVYNIGLKVTDNTPNAFPSSQMPALTDSTFDKVYVYDQGGLTLWLVEERCGQVEVEWSVVPDTTVYVVYTSILGPTHGFTENLQTENTTAVIHQVRMGEPTWIRVKALTPDTALLSPPLKVEPDPILCDPVPEVDFVANPLTSDAPATVTFTLVNTGGAITNVVWTFGDGVAVTNQSNAAVTHTYDAAGVYTVRLDAWGFGGHDQIEKIDYITVEDSYPRADFDADPLLGEIDLAVTFRDLSTGTITDWLWDFNGDGIIDWTSSQSNHTYQHVYTVAGLYDVALTVLGPSGSNTMTRSAYINVAPSNRPPVVCVVAEQIFLRNLGDMATLDASCSHDPDGDILFYSWSEGTDNPVRGLIPVGSDSLDRLNIYFPVPGQYNFYVQVSDGVLSSDDDMVITCYVPGLTGKARVERSYDVRLPDTVVEAYETMGDRDARVNAVDVSITDSFGDYVLDCVEPVDTETGRIYYLHVERNGYDPVQDQQFVQPDPEVSQQNYALRRGLIPNLPVTVTDTEGTPVEGILVAVDVADGEPPSDTTQVSGQAYLSNVPEGVWLVQIRDAWAAVDPDNRRFQDDVRDVRFDADMDALVLKVYPHVGGCSLRGRVTMIGTGLPVVNAQVLLGAGFEVYTDSDGSYIFTDIPSGVYEMRISREGYEPVRFPAVKVKPGTTRLNVPMAAQGIIFYGWVDDALSGHDLRNATVALVNEASGVIIREDISDYCGYFELADVPPGTNHLIRVKAPFGYRDLTQRVAIVSTGWKVLTLERDINWVEPEKPDLSGLMARVAVTNIYLEHMTQSFLLDGSPSVGENLMYVWTESPSNPQQNLVPGFAVASNHWQVSVTMPGIYIFELKVRNKDQNNQWVLSRNTAAITVFVPGLAGNVHRSPTDGMIGIHQGFVRAYPTREAALAWDDSYVDHALIGDVPAGDFALAGLSTGRVWVAARADNLGYNAYGPVRRHVNYSTAGAQTMINMVKGEYVVEGYVVRQGTTELLDNVRIAVAPGIQSETFRTTTDGNGEYRVGPVPGGTDQIIIAMKDGYEPRVIIQNIHSNQSFAFSMFPAESDKFVNLRGTITVNYEGLTLPVHGAEVVLGTGIYRTFTDAEGKYTFTGLTPGMYTGYVRKNGYKTLDLFVSGYRGLPAGTVTQDRSMVARGRTIVLRLIDAPAENNSGGVGSGRGGRKSTVVEANADGTILLDGVPDGEQEFFVVTDDGRVIRKTVMVDGDAVILMDASDVPDPDSYDVWAQWYFPDSLDDESISGMDADPDGDGMTNWEEFLAGTDPTRRDSRFTVMAADVDRTDSNRLFLRLNETSMDRVYQLLWTTDLVNGEWEPMGDPVRGTGIEMAIPIDNESPGMSFFKLMVVPAVD